MLLKENNEKNGRKKANGGPGKGNLPNTFGKAFRNNN